MRDPRREAAPKVCRLLRTKTAFGGGDDWKHGDSNTAVYWCLATMQPFGVDDQYCHPHSCQKGRVCFQDDED